MRENPVFNFHFRHFLASVEAVFTFFFGVFCSFPPLFQRFSARICSWLQFVVPKLVACPILLERAFKMRENHVFNFHFQHFPASVEAVFTFFFIFFALFVRFFCAFLLEFVRGCFLVLFSVFVGLFCSNWFEAAFWCPKKCS